MERATCGTAMALITVPLLVTVGPLQSAVASRPGAGSSLSTTPLSGRADDEKCGVRPDERPDMPFVITIVDGEVAADTLSKQVLEGLDIEHVEIICWRVVDREFGIEVRSGAVWILTPNGSANIRRRMRAGLSALLEARRGAGPGHRARDGGPSEAASDPEIPFVRFVRVASEGGWGATATHDLLAGACYIFAGALPKELRPPPDAGSLPGLTEGAPACWNGRSTG